MAVFFVPFNRFLNENHEVNMLVKIQRSLLDDLKQNHDYRSLVPRSAHDSLYKAVMNEDLTATVNRYRSFNALLCGEADPQYVFPNGFTLRLAGHPGVVRALRQTLGFFSRLSANVDQDTKTRQLEEAAARVSEQPRFDVGDSDAENMRRFIAFLFGPTPPQPDTWSMSHGPGAVAEGNKARKGDFLYVSPKLLQLARRHVTITTSTHVDPCGNHLWRFDPLDDTRWFTMPHAPRLCPGKGEGATRVVCVPKDATKVRIISCEPAATQFVQQGLMKYMYDRLARWPAVNPLDQSRNRELALMGSITRHIATLDSSNASDNVRWLHVQKLFPADWVVMFDYLRSEDMDFPTVADGVRSSRRVHITTFAPMGSALCFPVELAVFAAIAYAAGCRSYPMTPDEFLHREDIGFFGDDAIIPSDWYDDYVDLARSLAIPLNESKSCKGDVHFRESCGLDAFEGVDVSIVRPREVGSYRRAAAPMVLHANRLFAAGFVATAQCIASAVREPVSLGFGPHMAEPGLKWPRLGHVRFNAALQRFEGEVTFNRYPEPEPSQGWQALHMWFASHRQSTSPFLNSQKAIPARMWAPMDPSFALVQSDLNHKGIRYSPGSHPVARGTPSASASARTATEQTKCGTRVPNPEKSYTQSEWKAILYAYGYLPRV